jgi:hypothetical protein
LEVYDIRNNQITNAAFMGTVGLDWQVAGFGDLNGDGITDMVLRNSGSGAFEVYGISQDAITSAAFLGTVGLDWQVAGFGDFDEDGITDMVLRNSSTGAFEDYRISNNTITSATSLEPSDWIGSRVISPSILRRDRRATVTPRSSYKRWLVLAAAQVRA